MRRLLPLLGLLSTTALAQQAVPPLGTAALVCAYNTSIPVPVAGSPATWSTVNTAFFLSSIALQAN